MTDAKAATWTFVFLYLLGTVYGLASYAMGEALGLLSLITFGLLAFVYLFFLLLAPVIACVAGWQAVWSGWFAVVVGYPCVVLYAVVTPIVGDASNLGVPVPWLTLYPDAQADALRQIRISLQVSSVLFATAFVAGRLMRRRRARRLRLAPTLAELTRDDAGAP